MPGNDLVFQIVLEGQDLASPAIAQTRESLKLLAGELVNAGRQAQATATQEEQAAKAAAAAEAAAAKEAAAALQSQQQAALGFVTGIGQGFGVAVPLSVAAATAAVVKFAADS